MIEKTFFLTSAVTLLIAPCVTCFIPTPRGFLRFVQSLIDYLVGKKRCLFQQAFVTD